MIIRIAKPQDSEDIAELTIQLGYKTNKNEIENRINRINKNNSHIIYVASTENRILGYMQASSCDTLESGFRVEIIALVVSENSRRLGIGKKLVQMAVDWANNISAETIIVRSNIKRDISHIFYPAIGFNTSKTQILYRRTIEKSAQQVDAPEPATMVPPA